MSREEKIKQCECHSWARTDEGIFLTQHHPNCKKYDPVKDAKEIIKGLIDGIEAGAHDTDGVHPDLWDAYVRGKISIGEFNYSEQEV